MRVTAVPHIIVVDTNFLIAWKDESASGETRVPVAEFIDSMVRTNSRHRSRIRRVLVRHHSAVAAQFALQPVTEHRRLFLRSGFAGNAEVIAVTERDLASDRRGQSSCGEVVSNQ